MDSHRSKVMAVLELNCTHVYIRNGNACIVLKITERSINPCVKNRIVSEQLASMTINSNELTS